MAEKLAYATLVVDPFQAVRLANLDIDDVRRRVQQEECGRRGRTGDPLCGIRHGLLRGNERLTDHARARLDVGLAPGDVRLPLLLFSEQLLT